MGEKDANKHFLDLIRELRKSVYFNREDMEAAWPWSKSTISGYERGARVPELEYLVALSIETGHPIEDLIQARLNVGIIADRAHMLEFSDKNSCDSKRFHDVPVWDSNQHVKIDLHTLAHVNPKDLVACVARGDNMAPTIRDGEMMLADTSQKNIVSGNVYIVRLGFTVFAVRLQHNINDTISVIYDNPNSENQTLTQHEFLAVQIIGIRVVCRLCD